MSDNPMYWPGHQRPAWHQQSSGGGPPPMNHYGGHPGAQMGGMVPPPPLGPPGSDPNSVQVQSSIPGGRSTGGPQQSQQQPGGPQASQQQSSIYTTMMPPSNQSNSTPGGPSIRPPPQSQLNSTNSHLSSAASSATQQGMPPSGPHQTSMQQQPPTHPQSHYSHQYSSLGPPPYWNPGSMNSQPTPGGGPSGPPPSGPGVQSAPDPYTSASPLTMPNDSRAGPGMSAAATSAFHSPKDMQSSNDHMMSYDRRSGPMSQQHPSSMMSSSVPSSTASNLSPNPSSMRANVGGLHNQPPSMSQQASSWTNSYYGATTNQSPYVNPYMPYGSASMPTNHSSTLTQAPRPPQAMTQKIPVNGADRTRAVYPTHSNMYGQPQPTASSTNGGYYGYDPYYNPVPSQPPPPTPTDPYLSHSSSASSQHWSSQATGNSMISNSSAPPSGPPPPQTILRAPGSNIHPQSPSASSTLPSLPVRPPTQQSQTPDRSPAPPQHTPSYPSPGQAPSSGPKSTSNSLAQLEQMVMPGSGPSNAPSMKSPTHRSSTSSPSTNTQQQMQYSYNSSGQGSYFSSTGSSAPPPPLQSNYYSSYESSGVDVPKPNWSDQSPGMMMPAPGPVMMDSSQSYGQSSYDGSNSYGDYATLSAPNNIQSQYGASSSTAEQPAEKSDPYAIDSQTFDDYDDQTTVSKTKKSRAKKGDDSTKKERKPRASKASKAAATAAAAAAAAAPVEPPQSPVKTNSSVPEQQKTSSTPIPQIVDPSPSHVVASTSTYPSADPASSTSKSISEPPPAPYNQYDSSSNDPTKASWQDPAQSTSLLSHPPAPMLTEMSSHSSYVSPTSYDNSNSFSEYTTLSAPPKVPVTTDQPLVTSGPIETVAVDNNATPDEEIQSQPEKNDEQPAANIKTKKGSSKKGGDEAIKRERKPRPSRAKGVNIPPTSPQDTSSIQDPNTTPTAEDTDQTAPSYPAVDQASVQPQGHAEGLYPGFEGSKYDEYPGTSIIKQPQTDGDSTLPSDVNDPQNNESVATEVGSEPSASKPKKSRAKRSGDRPKREKKPKVAKTPSGSPVVELSTSPTNESQADLSIAESQASQPASEGTTSEAKPKRVRVRDPTKKKLPKFALKFAKTKKRKRLGSSDNDQSDLEKTPPPSPDEAESGVQKRRSARNTRKLKYNEDIGLGFSESDDDDQPASKPKKKSATTSTNADGETTAAEETVIMDEPTVFAAPVEDTMVVEKIMTSRTGRRELEPEPGEILPPDGTHIDVEEFYVKYKNLSYLHCDWRTLEELEKGDRRVAQKIKRWKQKKDSSNVFSFMDEDLFDPQYCEADRILAVNEVEEMVPDEDDEDEDKNNDKGKAIAIEGQDIEKSSMEIDESQAKVKPEQSTQEAPMEVDETSKDSNKIPDDDKLVSTADEPDTKADAKADEKVIKTSTETEVAEKEDNPESARPETDKLEVTNGEVDEAKTSDQPTAGAEDDPSKEESNAIQIVDEAPTNGPVAEENQVENPRKMKKKISRHYLVKWRGLSYEDSTWELEEVLDPDKIKQFERFKDPPPKSKWKTVKRPKPDEWVRKEQSPVYKNNNTLREYQLEGINWLSFCWHQGRNCILADEMGLGKTIQSIAFINEIFQYGIYGPFLIIVPLSTVGNWAREFETWTDMNVITYHGSSTSREMLKEYEMFYRNEAGNRITNYYKFQVMITTFEIILSDCLDLMKIPWRCCIIDEAHRLKNRNCKLLEGLRLLNMEHRVLLTGTPLQNNVEELFSLLNFLEPTQFSSTEQFLQEFGDLKTEAQVDKLKLILKPMMLRRLKEDVEKTLAPKEETIVEVELTNIQKKYYRAILEKNFSFLSKGTSSNNMPNLMNTMMELRKCCIHPYLINGAEEQILYEAKQTKLAGGEPMSSQQAMINSSGKLVLIDKLLPRLRADGHRVLIFSQMVRCLDILEDYVTHKHYPYERIDGRVRGSERQQAIDRYSKPGSDRFVFLLCTRAGGLGINLTAADTVIIFDSDWNPQNDLQAQARCHRIGQSKAVKIYRLICRNTYEREMFDKASLKLGLDKAVLQSMNTQKGGPGGVDGQLTKKEIEELLRKGAYGALMDDDNAGDKFCEEDIDHILQRRTQVITIDNSEAKGSTFSKATFSSSNNREDIELDDPNFWEKWAKKANIDSDDARTKEELIQLAPRRRTQTKRYGADGNLIDISDLESSEEDEETISMRTRGGRSGRSTKPTPGSASKRSKRNKYGDFDEDLATVHDGGYWSKSDCLKVETGLLTYGWGRWEEIIATGNFKRPLTPEDCESICRVILLYCLNSYKGDEKIKSSAWELILPPENSSKSESDSDATITTRGRKPKTAPIPTKKTVAEEIADAKWTKEAKNDPLIALPDDQYRRHLQRNCNKLLIRVKFLHYLRNDILRDQTDKILADCNVNEVDLLPCAVDGDLPASWWDDEADKSLLVGIFKHGHDRFNLIRQDPNLCFLHRCGPPNQEDLMKELLRSNKNADYFDDDVYGNSRAVAALLKSSVEGEVLDGILNNVVKDIGESNNVPTTDILDENKNTILKAQDQDETMESCENGVSEIQTKMEITDDESSMNDTSIDATIQESADLSIPEVDSNDLMLFPSANDLNQRFRRLITAHQRNSKKLEIKMAQKARDELKKERTSKFEAAKNEREERKRSLAQKWSRREESDFSKAVSFFGVEYMSDKKKHDWNKFRSIGKLDKKLDETLEEYYKAFVIMCKKVTSKPLTNVEEKCPINVEAIPEDRASKCLSRIDFFSRIREQTMTHPELDQRLQLCQSQSDLPDWWENGKHDKDLLIAACKHGLYRLDYNLAHDSSLSFDDVIKQKVEAFFKAPPTSILIALEQLQELLDRNGIEYIKDLDLHDNSEDVKGVIESLLDAVENEELDGTNEKDKSLLPQTRTPPKSTRSSAALSGFSSRPLPNILSRRGANTLVKSEENSGTTSLRLTSNGDNLRYDDRRVVEVTPILPDKMPAELKKTHEAGEVTITIQSESAMLRLDDRDPIILFGASHPITIKIRWPKDKAIQTRLDNLMHLVENNEWPSPPKPSVPTITLPNHLAPTTTAPSTPLSVTTSPPKGDKMDQSLGSPKSDVSAISSKTSKQETKEANSEVVSSLKGKRGRRKTKPEPAPKEPEHPVEDRQAAAKLRNLLSQGTSSNNKNSDRSSSKFGGKQAPGLSSLLAPSKTRRSDANAAAATSAAAAVATATTAPTASTGSINTLGTSTLTAGMPNQRPDLDLKSLLNLSAPGMANLLPQILANMKPEFRDLLSNPDSAQMILNSLSSMTGTGGLGTNLRSNANLPMTSGPSNTSQTRSSSKSGPPPAHSGAPPSAHGGSGGQSARELRRSFQHLRENSPPSINLRSTRGKVSMPSTDTSAHQKPMEMAHGKTAGGGSGSTSSTSKKRGRPSSRTSDSPPGGVSAADILDLSSLPPSLRGAAALQRAANDSRSRRNRDQGDDSLANILTRASSSGGTTSKSSPKSSSKAHGSSSQKSQEPTSPDKGVRTTRASKRIGSRIDALALNLQAKRMHRSDSPGLSPTLPKDSPQVAHGSVNKHSQEHKSRSPKVPPPAAHSGFHKSSSSSQEQQQTGAKQHSTTSSQSHIPTTTTPLPQAQPSTSLGQQQRQDPLAQLMNNSASLLAGLNPATLGNAGDFINQLLRKAGSNDMVKNLMNELIKNPSLALDPNILGALTALPMASQALPGFPLPTSTPTIPTSLPPTSMSNPGKNTPGSLLNDFKPPSSGGNSSSKRSRHDTSSSRHSNIGSHTNLTNEGNRRSSSSSSSATTATTAVPTTAPGGNMFFRNAQQQAANAALANSLMNLASQPNSAANPYNNYTNPLANPFLPFGLGNLGLNNPLGMAGLFPNLYLPGFQTPNTSQQQQSSNQQSGNPTDGQAPKDKKMRYPRK